MVPSSDYFYDLERHKTMYFTGEYSCQFCRELFISQEIVSHEAMCRLKKRWQNMEDITGKQRCKSGSEATQIKTSSVDCQDCNEQFESPGLLALHKLTYHMEKQPEVSKKQSSDPTEQPHVHAVQPTSPVEDVFQCMLCPKQYTNKKSYYTHVSRHSPKYVCDMCTFGSTSLLRLQQHKEQHSTGSRFCCHCQVSFDRRTISRHEKICQSKPSINLPSEEQSSEQGPAHKNVESLSHNAAEIIREASDPPTSQIDKGTKQILKKPGVKLDNPYLDISLKNGAAGSNSQTEITTVEPSSNVEPISNISSKIIREDPSPQVGHRSSQGIKLMDVEPVTSPVVQVQYPMVYGTPHINVFLTTGAPGESQTENLRISDDQRQPASSRQPSRYASPTSMHRNNLLSSPASPPYPQTHLTREDLRYLPSTAHHTQNEASAPQNTETSSTGSHNEESLSQEWLNRVHEWRRDNVNFFNKSWTAHRQELRDAKTDLDKNIAEAILGDYNTIKEIQEDINKGVFDTEPNAFQQNFKDFWILQRLAAAELLKLEKQLEQARHAKNVSDERRVLDWIQEISQAVDPFGIQKMTLCSLSPSVAGGAGLNYQYIPHGGVTHVRQTAERMLAAREQRHETNRTRMMWELQSRQRELDAIVDFDRTCSLINANNSSWLWWYAL